MTSKPRSIHMASIVWANGRYTGGHAICGRHDYGHPPDLLVTNTWKEVTCKRCIPKQAQEKVRKKLTAQLEREAQEKFKALVERANIRARRGLT